MAKKKAGKKKGFVPFGKKKGGDDDKDGKKPAWMDKFKKKGKKKKAKKKAKKKK